MTGNSGTGKTITALQLAKEAMKGASREENVVYICNSAGLKSFVGSQLSSSVTVVKRTNSFSASQKAMLQKAKLILVDDAHAIELDEHWESNPNDLYRLLFTHSRKPNSRVAIFFDPEQDYKEKLPKDFATRLRNLAETVLPPQDIVIITLND